MYQILLGLVRVQHVFGTPLIEIRQDLMPVWQMVVKRGMDIGISLLVLLLGSPFFLTVALITKLTSRGPVLFFQERIGKSGVPFNIIKFRSMYVDAEKKGPALSSATDPRITSWGRFMRRTRIDEFPQFFNVLIGEMSLVGPRPERQFFIDKIMKVAPHYRHLNRVRPGITSLGQVKYGYAENVEEMVRRLKFDIIYIENMSLGMDFRILIYTVLTVLGAKGK
jgi:lipopolysaccharide/colanic/teichoic acid biosynthesis glycosyltransferase